jgi:predicted secreted hydrolase
MTSDKRAGILLLGLLAFGLLLPSNLQSDEEWEIARKDYAWSFPEDHWARDGYKTEWWYFTGHLEAETGERFGYQFTFFRVGMLKEIPAVDSDWGAKDLIMGHAALSVLKTSEQLSSGSRSPVLPFPRSDETHRFSEVVYRAVPLLGGFGEYPDKRLAWSRAPAGTEETWELEWNGEAFDFSAKDDALGFGFQLSTEPMKALILQGPNGYSKKGEGASAASQYYSFTRLKTEGVVDIDGKRFSVRGQSWMDKEFSTNSLGKGQVGWDWFSLQLDDQRELMLYILRDESGNIDHARGTLVATDGSTRYLGSDQFTVTTLDTWESSSGDDYPSAWKVGVPSAELQMTITSQLGDQENRSRLIPTLRYWEGAVSVKDAGGKQIGVGFVEMTGYGSASTPAL